MRWEQKELTDDQSWENSCGSLSSIEHKRRTESCQWQTLKTYIRKGRRVSIQQKIQSTHLTQLLSLYRSQSPTSAVYLKTFSTKTENTLILLLTNFPANTSSTLLSHLKQKLRVKAWYVELVECLASRYPLPN